MRHEERKAEIAKCDWMSRESLGRAFERLQNIGFSVEEARASLTEWYEEELRAIAARKRTGDPEPTALDVLETYKFPRAWAIFAARHDVAKMKERDHDAA